MPSSAEHCGDCLFGALEEADEYTTFLEARFVEGHLLALNGVENADPIDLSHTGLSKKRITAARGCAMLIANRICKRFVGPIVRTNNRAVIVLLIERDDYESE